MSAARRTVHSHRPFPCVVGSCTECDGPVGLRTRSARRRETGTAERLALLMGAAARVVVQEQPTEAGVTVDQ